MKRSVLILMFLFSCNSLLISGELSGSLTSFGGGPAFASGDSIGSGFAAFFNYGRVANENLALRGEITYYSFSVDVEHDYGGYFASSYSGTRYGGGLRFDVLGGSFSLAERFLAYGILGFGVNVDGGSGDFKATTTLAGRTTSDSKSVQGGPDFSASFRIGAGGGYRITPTVAIILEIKYEVVGDFNYVPLRFGFSFLP